MNPLVSIVTADEKQQITFQAQGQATLVTDAETSMVAFSILRNIDMKSDDWMPPITKLNAGSYEVYKIRLTYAKLRMFGDKRKSEKPFDLYRELIIRMSVFLSR